MPTPPRRRFARTAAALLLALSVLLPATAPAAAADPPVLRVGTTQDLDSMNPFQTALVVGFEAFTLNYELLVGFDQNLAPAPEFADSWTKSDDGLTYTFKISPNKKWSDGTPATSEDVRWTYQFILDAVASDAEATCLGYLDPYLSNAGLTTVTAPDPQTVVLTLERPDERILQTYVPILPKHIWGTLTLDTICDFQNEPPVVGSGPYQAQQWQTGQFVNFTKNSNWSHGALAADQLVLQIFKSADTMVQALRAGELDYAHGVNPQQFDALKNEPNVATQAATANGYTELGFNTYGTGTGNTIEGGGPSTKALLDPKFRDALGYAIDKSLLVEKVLGGYGDPGSTNVPPFQTRWHKEPSNPRTFDIELAKQKLDEAGYKLDASGKRLDKEGKPINLSLVFPDSESTYPSAAEFIQGWFEQLGIGVSPQQFDSDTLIDKMLPPEAGDYKADFDMFIWGWAGDVDPNSLLEIFTCDQIGNSSDSLFCDPDYDALFKQQNEATSYEQRKALMDQMQDLIYNEAPYHILFYDASLEAWRTDRFAGWTLQPAGNGSPLFGYGSFGYRQLQVAGAETPTPAASADTGASAAPTPAPSGDGEPASSGGDNTLLIVGVIVVIVVLVAGLVLARQRGGRAEEE
jgi:peptide/nickel transport system substrate-binding protein